MFNWLQHLNNSELSALWHVTRPDHPASSFHSIYGKWEAFINKLKAIEEDVERKTKLGYSLEKRMPSQLTLLQLADECLMLSEAWHGKGLGNLSCFYAFFYRICEKSQTTFYRYSELRLQKSKDGYLTLLDMETKNALQQKHGKEVLTPYKNQGGLWAGGRSPIDNTNLATVFLPQEGQAILAANGLKRWILAYLQKKQGNILKKISSILEIPLKQLEGKELADALETLASDKNETLQAKCKQQKLKIESLAFTLLKQYGKPIEDWGQVPQAAKEALWKMAVAQQSPKESSPPKGESASSVWQDVAKQVKEKPGDFLVSKPIVYQSETTQSEASISPRFAHALLQYYGLSKGSLYGISRSSVEGLTPIRYLPFTWTRAFPLENIIDNKKLVVRPAKAKETSRIRANQGTYQPGHGIPLSSSGLPEGSKVHHSGIYEVGVSLDPTAASVSNMHCDIEKILREVKFLNPTSKNPLLPGEGYFTVGQNSVTGSSIKATQHTQISAGTLKDFPLYDSFQAPVCHCDSIKADVSIVPVGEGSFFLKMITDDPTSDSFLKCLVDLKMSLLEKFGGIEKVDFHLHAIPDGKGKFVVIFAPLVRLEIKEREVKEAKEKIYCNFETNQNHKDLNLPAEHIHLANAVGTFGVDFSDKAMMQRTMEGGVEVLKQLWDFTAKRGAKEHVMDFLERQIGYKHEPIKQGFQHRKR